MAGIHITLFPDWNIEGGGWLGCPFWNYQSLDLKFEGFGHPLSLLGSDAQVGWYTLGGAEELLRD